MGDQRTTQRQLDEASCIIFGKLFKGVFAFDEDRPKSGYVIVNTGTRTSSGEHWLARANGAWYDSFGRKQYGDLSGDAEQDVDEYDCGQRCLAWLCVYHTHGARLAKLI